MPKIVNHAKRRHDIASAACRAIAKHGLDDVTLVQIARESGHTTGMLAHYFPTKWDVIMAALELMHVRIEKRLSLRLNSQAGDMADLMREVLPIDEERRAETAAWLTFWGAALKRSDLLEMSSQTHLDWRALIRRCLLVSTPSSANWQESVMIHVISSVVVFMDGIYVKALTRASVYPEDVQVELLTTHIHSLLRWADERSSQSASHPAKSSSNSRNLKSVPQNRSR
ncbi:MAG: TetR/AcrR family transcriptional regulator [Mesorhizobium sp.]|nr:MAG: TetR/AcrR family transcriptional regulator [Mesorhizobium sp.]